VVLLGAGLPAAGATSAPASGGGAVGTVTVQRSQPTAPAKVIGPIPITVTSYPWNAAAHSATPLNLTRHGYVEAEYRVGG